MRKHSNNSSVHIRPGLFIVSITLVLMVIFIFVTANKSSKNVKPQNAYERELQKLEHVATSKYADVTWDGTDEMLVEYKSGGGSGMDCCIFTYKDGTVKSILNIREYGLETITAYKDSKSLILYGMGHGGEWYRYFQMTDGKFKYLGEKARTAISKDDENKGSWLYYDEQDNIPENDFKKIASGLKTGKRKTIKLY